MALLGKAMVPHEIVVREKKKQRLHGKLNQEDKQDLVTSMRSKQSVVACSESEQLRQAQYTAALYIEKYVQYYNKRGFSVERLVETPAKRAQLSRIFIQSELLDVSVQDFIESQFYWFNKTFTRAPFVTEIASNKALTRFQEWALLRQYQRIDPKTIHVTAIKPNVLAPINPMEMEIKILERMIRRWGSEEQVWKICADDDEDPVFSLSFKRSRPLWVAIYGGGE